MIQKLQDPEWEELTFTAYVVDAKCGAKCFMNDLI